MKIYASKGNKHTIDDFIGKDVWLLALHRGGCRYWIRILKKERGQYIINAAPWSFVDYAGFKARNANFYKQHQISWFYNDIILAEPLEILTTEEVFGG